MPHYGRKHLKGFKDGGDNMKFLYGMGVLIIIFSAQFVGAASADPNLDREHNGSGSYVGNVTPISTSQFDCQNIANRSSDPLRAATNPQTNSSDSRASAPAVGTD
jgi:hypothetical protein